MSEETPGTKLELISIEIRRRQKHYHNSLRHVILFSLILLIFFSMYTALVIYKIREIATPTTVALLIAGELRDEAASDNSRLTSEDFQLLSREAAHGAVSFLPLLSGPLAEQKIRTLLAEKNLSAAERCAGEIFSDKAYREVLLEMAKQPEHAKTSPQEREQRLARILKSLERSRMAETHPLQILTPGFIGERLKTLRLKQKETWTDNDGAVRDLMLCTLYFQENKRYKDSDCRVLFELLDPLLLELGLLLPEAEYRKTVLPLQNKTKHIPINRALPARK